MTLILQISHESLGHYLLFCHIFLHLPHMRVSLLSIMSISLFKQVLLGLSMEIHLIPGSGNKKGPMHGGQYIAYGMGRKTGFHICV